MDLLPYKTICQFPTTIPDKPKSLVVIYKMTNPTPTIFHQFYPELNTILENLLQNTKSGDDFPSSLIYTPHTSVNSEYSFIVLVGIKEENNISEARKASAIGLNTLKNANIQNCVFSCDYMPEQIAIGAVLAAYSYNLFKKTKRTIAIDSHQKNESFETGKVKAMHQNFARFLADTPANHMTPTHFVSYAKDFLRDSNLNIDVHEREYLIKHNMNLFLSVTEGSDQPPKLLVIKYCGKTDKSTTDVSLVGKGITFDSGGISLKPPRNMSDMKADMMGAASVLAAISLIAHFKVSINVTVTIPLCENLPSGKASKPGDVRISMSGLSVEIDNTDAEGRLILGDAMTHAQKDMPKYMIDVATLTGAMVVSLGNVYMGLFSNDDEFADVIKKCGKDVYDEVWRMPLDKKYKGAMKSNVADIKNIGTSGGGSCTAAIFLNEFIEDKVKWAHFDVAGVMNKVYDKEIFGDSMSGKPTCLLYEIVTKLANMK